MADRIITVTNPSIVTNDTLSGYNNYSDIDGQLGTTMTPTEAANGHTVALSDGVVHEVTTKPVGTTNGEFSAVVSNAVTVDLVTGTTYALRNDPAQDSTFYTTANIEWVDGYYVEFRIGAFHEVSGSLTFTHQTADGINGAITFKRASASNPYYTLSVSDSVDVKTTALLTVVIGDLIRIERSGNDFTLSSNGTPFETLTTVGYTPLTGKKLVWGGNNLTGTQNVRQTIYDIDLNGSTFPLSEQSGGIATGSGSDTITLYALDNNYTEMWTTIV